MVYFWQIKKISCEKCAIKCAQMTANAQQETFKVRKVILQSLSTRKVITYLHNCAKALQDWHVTPGGGRGAQ